MIAKAAQDAPVPAVKEHATFFRQSGWIMVATVVGGFMSLGTQVLSKKIDENQYKEFGVLLMLVSCLPTLPLQMVFAQQTASALAMNRTRQLSGMIRLIFLSTLLLWLAGVLGVYLFQGRITQAWGLTNPAALWVAVLAILATLLTPTFGGVLLGRQNFFWVGWIQILTGAGRLVVAALLVLALAAGATGMMIGVLAGMFTSAFIGIWFTRDLWKLPPDKFDIRNLLRQVVPLTLGFWSFQFIFTYDSMYATTFFKSSDMAPYFAAGTLSRAVLWLVLPMAAVMFPKLVHSRAKSEKSNLLGIVLIGTAILAVCGGIGLCIFGPLAIRLVFRPEWVRAASALLPWYAGAMVPLAVANVLVNNLMARGCFKVVPAMVVIAVAYGILGPYALNHFPGRLELVLQILAVVNLLLLVACGIAAFLERSKS